jgi:hypothetical protein
MGESMKHINIPLTNGGFTIVDECDIDFVLSKKWYFIKSRKTMYVKTGKNQRLHRMLLNVDDPKKIVDHINGNGLDNRRLNLRVVDLASNVANRQKSRGGYRCPGVYPQLGKWRAQVTVNYKKHNLGLFTTEEQAIQVVNNFRRSIGRPEVKC